MTEESIFNVLILIARPGAGKSEIIHYLKNLTDEERIRRFHTGRLEEIDDFPMLWTWFEEDALLEEMGRPRLHTNPDGYFNHPSLWNLLIRRIGLEYTKLVRDRKAGGLPVTTLVEFSRGSEHGGYRESFKHLSSEMTRQAAVLYIKVSFEESLRKNRRRYNPDKPDSILEHGLSDEKLRRLYAETDWDEVSAADREFLDIAGVKVPYVVMENEDDITTPGGEALGKRLEEVLGRLWGSYQKRSQPD